jgi:Spy/CpxP family protein refolding chaperone
VSSNTRTAAIAVVVVAFIAGILAGVAGDHLYLIKSGRLSPRHGRFSAERMTDRLTHQLDLTSQQKTQVQQIIERHRAKIDATMANVSPKVRQEVEATNAEIETVLTAEQKAKFADLRMRIEARRRDRNSPRP